MLPAKPSSYQFVFDRVDFVWSWKARCLSLSSSSISDIEVECPCAEDPRNRHRVHQDLCVSIGDENHR